MGGIVGPRSRSKKQKVYRSHYRFYCAMIAARVRGIDTDQ